MKPPAPKTRFTVGLDRDAAEAVQDLIDNRLTDMHVIDREDTRIANALVRAKDAFTKAVPLRSRKRLDYHRRPVQ